MTEVMIEPQWRDGPDILAFDVTRSAETRTTRLNLYVRSALPVGPRERHDSYYWRV